MNFHEHKRDIIAISAISVITIAITLLLLNIDLKVGVYYVRDVFFYLNNALFYAGYDVGLTDTRGLSPLIPMITSIFFRMGFVSDGTIIIVSSVFYIFSALGMYFLLRLRFDEVLSFTGSMHYKRNAGHSRIMLFHMVRLLYDVGFQKEHKIFLRCISTGYFRMLHKIYRISNGARSFNSVFPDEKSIILHQNQHQRHTYRNGPGSGSFCSIHWNLPIFKHRPVFLKPGPGHFRINTGDNQYNLQQYLLL